MTLNEINTLIKALENSSCTFSNCRKLADLYICRDHIQQNSKTLHNKEKGQKFDDFLLV